MDEDVGFGCIVGDALDSNASQVRGAAFLPSKYGDCNHVTPLSTLHKENSDAGRDLLQQFLGSTSSGGRYASTLGALVVIAKVLLPLSRFIGY